MSATLPPPGASGPAPGGGIEGLSVLLRTFVLLVTLTAKTGPVRLLDRLLTKTIPGADL